MSVVTTCANKPITLNMKIGEILKEHPELLDVIVAQSPHFKRLKNPILRKVHGKLVTLAQAAAIAGIEPFKLVRTLNAVIGQTSIEEGSLVPSSMAGLPEPPWVASAPVVASLDVREDQRQHSDPFQRIMAEIAKVENGQTLYLRNTFEPLPLYDVLARVGFVAWARNAGPEDWEIYFHRIGEEKGEAKRIEENSETEQGEDTQELDDFTPVATVTIDVRDLTPPQPMLKILAGLDGLEPGQTLLVHHQRRPVHLYPKLAELGYKQKTIERGPDQIDIYIQKPK